jgi:hypothetical protein
MFKYGDIQVGDTLVHTVFEREYKVTAVNERNVTLEDTLILAYNELGNYRLKPAIKPGWVLLPAGFIYAETHVKRK